MRFEQRFGDRVVPCFVRRPASLDALLANAVSRAPDSDAVVAGDRRLSYAELDDEAGRVAAGLAAVGVGPGDRIALMLGNRAEFVTTLFGARRLGAVVVPVNVRERGEALHHVLTHSGARALVHEAEIEAHLPGADTLPALATRHAAGAGDGAGSYASLAEHETDPPARHAPGEEDVAVILYTSGTTGRPKGAMLTEVNLAHSALHYELCLGLDAGERSMLAVPASHVTGLVATIVTMVRVAGAIVMMERFRAPDFITLAARERITHAVMVPAMYNLCLREPAFGIADLSSWKIGGYGGAPMPEAAIEALAERLPGLVLVNAYGATETTSPATLMPRGHTRDHSDSVGRVVPCGRVVVMDEAGREVPRGEPGEIWIGGPMVVPGYWDDPETTTAAFVGGYWRSGDIGSMDEAGYVRVFDRTKDLINRGGYKIYSVEVENVLAHHPDVVEAAVVAQPDPVLGEKTHAFVTCRDASAVPSALAEFCATRLADYKVPDFWTLDTELLPRNANGKVRKNLLRARAGSDEDPCGGPQ
jgi:O-succinylbenzoic acid--CoA ligase